jgi:hypothetical protein
MAASQDLTAPVHPIIRTTMAQYYVNQAVTRGVARQQVQPGSVTCIQRCGGAMHLHVHFPVVFLAGVYLDRTEQGRTPRFVTGEPPNDAYMPAVLQKISRRAIRTLRQRGYLETGYAPLRDNESELVRAMAASVTQCIAFGERTGQNVRRIGSGFGYEGEHPTLTAPIVPMSTGFRSMRTPRSQRIGVTSWNA